jgi:DNA-directed RNA polymerase subunit RPC12/RpoP
MLTRIICPNCGHVGATSATLPRILVCSQCGHGAFIKQGNRARSPTVTREESEAKQAAWDRSKAMGTQTKVQA